MNRLPIDDVLPEVASALDARGVVVLQAPPGAGKTTRVPLYLNEHCAISGRILMLEPRRVAARSAATFMAKTLGEDVGARVGYRMRGDSRTSAKTVVEVVTEGVLTRMLQSDPELSGIGCIIFDEFHERSLQADLGLALALEVRSALRPDLKIVVMSATLDAAPVAALLGDAPVVTSEGRSFAVETRWLERPWSARDRRGAFERAAIDLIARAVQETTGGVLVFLPGAGEIARVQSGLSLSDAEVSPLYGAMPLKDQMRVLAPRSDGVRKLVLATAIAETSLTIPDVRVVVDCGQARRSRFDPGSGMSRLMTERVSLAEAEQRRGRAGRVAEGVCYRMWTKGQEGGLSRQPPVEIEDNDLLGFALDLAVWGARDPSDMLLLTQPPLGAFGEAQELLKRFGALSGDGAITDHGRAVAALPLHPRLAQMVIKGRALGMGWTAPVLAALLNHGRLGRDEDDISAFVGRVRSGDRNWPPFGDIKRELSRIGAGADTGATSIGALLSLAYPDRVGQQRNAGDQRYLLSSGKGAHLSAQSALMGASFLTVADLDGDKKDARIRLGGVLGDAELRELHEVEARDVCFWDKRHSKIVAEKQARFGAIALEREIIAPPAELQVDAAIEGLRELGLRALPWSGGLKRLCARVEWARARGADMADMSQAGLLDDLDWAAPYLSGVMRASDFKAVDLAAALDARLGWSARQELDQLVPVKFTAPTGTNVQIDYDGDLPKVSVRLQEMLGLGEHPVVGPDRTPLLIELLSPAQRPIPNNVRLARFWTDSYFDVRKDMRGRYPKHVWPENPLEAVATRRAKPRGR